MDYLKEIKNAVASFSDIIISANDEIWGYNELYFEEYLSSKKLAEYAQQNGFTINMGICDMPTAFCAKWGESGPKIAFLAEYDALPNLNQAAGVTKKCPSNGKTQNDAGHGCGHNSLAAGSLGAALALKEYCANHSLPVQILLFGCPAEENGSGKMFLARSGFFNDMDACITWHPDTFNEVSGQSTLACLSTKFTFHGVTSHASATPHLGRSALDACEIMNVGINYLREHIIPEARVHYSYLDVGGKAPNVVQDIASTYYFVRAPKVNDAMAIAKRVYLAAKGAAMITGTTVDIEKLDGLCDYIPNRVLGQVGADIFKQIGAPKWSKEDVELATDFFKTFDEQEILRQKERICKPNGLDIDDCSDMVLDSNVSPYIHEPYVVESGSTDVGDVSYCAPTVQFHIANSAIGTPGHSWQRTGQGTTAIAHKGTLTAACVMAATAVKLITEPELLEKARAEHTKSVANGYICPAPPTLKPTIS